MLIPKRTKYRKQFRGRMKGKEHRGNTVTYGEFGLVATEPSWITSRHLLFVLRRVRTQLALIKDALDDIKGGNLNRRILAGENDMTKTICYDINKIAVNSQAQLIRQRQSEQAYKRLMTSLSHDVKTPL